MVFGPRATDEVIHFLSFAAALLIYPKVIEIVKANIPQEWLHFILPFVLTYIAAVYLFPRIGWMIYMSFNR